ncbi:MAG: hypothetical protein ACRDTD_31420, partial [Pseudonocardiaceae bacterium]
MTRPENTEPTEAQLRREEPKVAAEDPVVSNRAASSTSPPLQRQRNVPGDGDQKTVRLQVGAPEHSRDGAVREQSDRQPVGSRPYGFSPGVGRPVAEGTT